jgi:hypothetical protein
VRSVSPAHVSSVSAFEAILERSRQFNPDPLQRFTRLTAGSKCLVATKDFRFRKQTPIILSFGRIRFY